MSRYTTQVRFICENLAGMEESKGYNDINDIITTAAPLIFDFDFPIFAENHRLPLEIKILRHYYTREICEETVGLWKLRLEDRLNLIMPYYNQLYRSELLEFNPFYDIDLETISSRDGEAENYEDTQHTETRDSATEAQSAKVVDSDTSHISVTDTLTDTGNDYTSQIAGDASSDTTTTTQTTTDTTTDDTASTSQSSDRWDLYSDTPQGGLAGIDPPAALSGNNYLTNARHNTEEVTSEGENSSVSQSQQDTDTTTSSLNANSTYQVDHTDTTTVGSTDLTQTTAQDVTENISNNSTDTAEITSTGNKTAEQTSHEETEQRTRGKQGGSSYSQLLSQYRETFLNIDKMIIEELSDLFFGLLQ